MSRLQPDNVSADETLSMLRDWIRLRFGITYGEALQSIFVDRISNVCQSLGTTPALLLAGLLEGDRHITLKVSEAVSTNYTFFFRESNAFSVLARETFSSLPPGPIRMWSAATSSGEEAYSLAVASCEAMGLETARQRVRILGTDISTRQLEHAEAALYKLPPSEHEIWHRLAPWVEMRASGHLEIIPAVREMCTFRRMNLLQQSSWPFEQRFHVIFLRNVLYYFETEAQKRILDACYAASELGGWLFTSLTEPVAALAAPWREVQTAVYRREA